MQLRKLVKLIEQITDKKTPVDIVEFLEKDRYSKSKKRYIEIGSMDLFHLIRSMKKKDKSKVDIETAELIEQLKKTNEKINKLARKYELEG